MTFICVPVIIRYKNSIGMPSRHADTVKICRVM